MNDAWRQWIATCLMSGTGASAIADIMRAEGFDDEVARSSIEAIRSDPICAAGRCIAERLAKLESYLDVRHELEWYSSSGTVDRCRGLSSDDFLSRYYAANKPVLLDDVTSGWPALDTWSPEYLSAIIGDEIVEVMGDRDGDPRYEINSNTHKRLVPFAAYAANVASTGWGNNTYLVANNHLLERDSAAPLWGDFTIDERYLDRGAGRATVFLWFGSAGTVTPLHHDVANVLFTQIRGHKRFTLISPMQSHCVYNDLGVYSDVDPDAPDLERFPRFARVQPIEVVVGPGDALFIPAGWWHHVVALEMSISVSFTNFRFPNSFIWQHPAIGQDAW